MIKNFYRGLAVLAFASLLLATLVPAPLFAATGYSIHTGMEQDTDQGDDDQDEQDDQDDQDVNTQDDSTQNQVQQDQGQQQVTGQDACANLTILGGSGADQQVQQQTDGLTVGTSRRTAAFPTNCWVSLGPDETHWYQFRYQGLAATDDDDDDDSDSTGTQPDTVNARLQMDTAGCVDFWVMTPRRLQNPDPDDDDINEPVGAGTPAFIIEEDGDNRDESELTWQGSAAANVTFYILVMNNRDFSCAYNLSLEGAGVPVQGQQNQGQQNQGQQQGQQNQGQQQGQQNQGQQNQNQQQGQQNQQGSQLSSCGIGSNTNTAGFPAGCWVSLNPNETHWYQFRYQGLDADTNDDDGEDDDSTTTDTQPDTVTARLQMDTAGCVAFQVMTPRRLQNPDPDDDDINEPVGVGSPAVIQNDDDDSDNRDETELVWQGSGDTNTAFYIIVRNTRDFSCTYSLSLEGAGVPAPGQPGQQDQLNQQNQGQQNQGQQDQQDDQSVDDQNGDDQNGDDQNDDDQDGEDNSDDQG